MSASRSQKKRRKAMEAPKIKHVLRDKDILKASNIFGLDEVELRKMNDLRLLNTEYLRDVLIRYDYESLTNGARTFLMERNSAYTFPEVRQAIMSEYGISAQTLNAVLKGTNNKSMYFCKMCGNRITKRQYDTTHGLCVSCAADTIGL